MPAPSNISFATAIDIGTVPLAYAQSVVDAGTTYTVFYRFTAPSTSNEVGIWSFGGTVGSGYRPFVRVYDLDENQLFQGGLNKPVQVPVTQGQSYYLEVVKNGDFTPSDLTLTIEAAPSGVYELGDLVIPDDSGSIFPATILDPSSGVVKRYIHPFPSGEAGDILSDGTMLVEDIEDTALLKIYDSTFTLRATVAPITTAVGFQVKIRANPTSGIFYLADAGIGALSALVTTVNPDGSYGPTTWNVGSSMVGGAGGLAVSTDDSILYYVLGGAATQVHMWDLISDADAGTLGAAEAINVFEIQVDQESGKIIVGHYSNSANQLLVNVYSEAGALLYSVDLHPGDAYGSTSPRIGRSTGGAFWVWAHLDTGFGRFTKINLSDGSTITEFERVEFSGGVYQGAETDTPVSRFGHAPSCPFFEYTAAQVIIIDESIPCCESNAIGDPCDCAGGTTSSGSVPTGSPSSQPPSTSTGPILPPELPLGPVNLLSDAYWDQACEGGGLVPTAADPVDDENWAEVA